MKNLKYLEFGNYCENCEEPFDEKCIEGLILIVKIISMRNSFGPYCCCLHQIQNMKNRDMAIITDFYKDVIIDDDIKFLNLILRFPKYDEDEEINDLDDEWFEEIGCFGKILENLPIELESLQISINKKCFEKCTFFTNSPIGLKIFDLHLFDEKHNLKIDISKIKIPFECKLKYYLEYRSLLKLRPWVLTEIKICEGELIQS